jgi:hypothetical protein
MWQYLRNDHLSSQVPPLHRRGEEVRLRPSGNSQGRHVDLTSRFERARTVLAMLSRAQEAYKELCVSTTSVKESTTPKRIKEFLIKSLTESASRQVVSN